MFPYARELNRKKIMMSQQGRKPKRSRHNKAEELRQMWGSGAAVGASSFRYQWWCIDSEPRPTKRCSAKKNKYFIQLFTRIKILIVFYWLMSCSILFYLVIISIFFTACHIGANQNSDLFLWHVSSTNMLFPLTFLYFVYRIFMISEYIYYSFINIVIQCI